MSFDSMKNIGPNNSLQHIKIIVISILSIANTSYAQQTAVLEWARRMGGTGNDGCQNIVLDAAGNIYTTGFYSGTADFDPGTAVFNMTSKGGSDTFITKLDANGNLIWAKSIGGTAIDGGAGIAVDASGNVYITGGFSGTSDFDPGPGTFNMTAATTGQTDIFIAKLDANGDFVWAKGVLGGTWWDNGLKIVVDASGNVVVVGRVYFQGGARDFDPGPGTFFVTIGHEDAFILKLDTNGNFVWVKTLGGVDEDRGYSIALDAAGNIFTTGYFESTADFDPGPSTFNLTASGDWDVFISKLTKDGDFVWAKAMVNSNPTYYTDGIYGSKIALDAAGNVYTTSRFNGTVDFDPGAGVFNLTSLGGFDIYVSKLTNDGDFVWAKSMGGSGYDEGLGVALDASGDVYISGTFVQTVDFDPGAGVFNLTSAGSNDIFICKLDSDGNFEWARSMSGTGDDRSVCVVLDAANNVYLTGWFQGTVDFDPGACTYNLVSAGSNDIFIQKLRQTTILPTPTIAFFTPSNGPVGTTVTITGTNFSTLLTDNVVNFFNAVPATVTASTETSITVLVPAGATTGKITVSVNCVSVISADDFTVTVGPVITISPHPASLAVCDGVTTSFTTAATGTTNITYQWQFSTTFAGTYTDINNGGGFSNAGTASISVNTTSNFGAGFYRCRITGDLASPVFTDAAQLTINALPAAPTVTNGSSCGTGSVTLNASGGANGEYRWYTVATGGTAIAGEVNNSYITPAITATTPYFVSINNGLCESLRTQATATVNPLPAIPTITSNITLLGNAVTICSTTSLTLSAPNGFSSYSWSSGATTSQLIVTASGTYSVIVTDGAGCSSPASDAITVTVVPAPCNNSAPVINNTTLSTTIGNTVSIDLSALISDADNNLLLSSLTILQQPTSGAQASLNGTTLQINYAGISFTGTDAITIRVCDVFGECTTQQLQINVIGEIEIFNGVSHNNDGKNDFFKIQNIEFLDPENTVTIYNRWGSKVFEVDNYNPDNAFRGLNQNSNELPSGTYFYKIVLKSSQETKTGFLVLKR